VVVDAFFCSAPMALVAWWYARAIEGFALEGAWLDDRMARTDGAIYLRERWAPLCCRRLSNSMAVRHGCRGQRWSALLK